MTFQNFSNFCRKKIPGLAKRLLQTFLQFLGLEFAKIMWQDVYFYSISAGNLFYQAWNFFFCRNLKNFGMSFWANVMLGLSRLRASRASPALKSQGLRVVCFQNFSLATFYVFCVIKLVASYFSYLPVKQI